MKSFVTLVAIFSVGFFYHADAQQVIKKDTLNGTELTMQMDKRVSDNLETMEESCSRVLTKPRHSTGTNDGTDYTESSYSYTAPRTPATASSTKIVVPARALTNAEICRKNPKILGYKIQLVVVKSNEEAQKVKAYFRNRFPAIKVETDASLRPNYKVLAGSYLTKQSASGDLSRIRQYFASALPVQYRVFCVEAK